MKKLLSYILTLVVLVILITIFSRILITCTNQDMGEIKSFRKPGHITCYSGGMKIYEGYSSGATEFDDKVLEFMDSKTNKFIRISGDCISEH